jgi:hypothetical protein
MSLRPGKSFVQMFDLVYSYNFAKATFSDRLLIGIFWEESMFNNVFQVGGGTGVGFGQVEPAEFPRMTEFGLLAPSTEKVGGHTKSTRALSDKEAVQAAAALLGSMFKRLGGSRASVLRGYAGYQWALANPGKAKPTANQRLAIIAGWEACEQKLKDIFPFRRPDRAEENVILDGLNKARSFASRREEFRSLLFRDSDYRSI